MNFFMLSMVQLVQCGWRTWKEGHMCKKNKEICFWTTVFMTSLKISRFRALFFTDVRNKWKIPMMLHERLNRKGKKSTFKFTLIGNWWDEYTRYNNLNKEQFCTSSILVEVKWFKQIHYEKSVSALHSVVLCRRLEQGNCLKPRFFFLYVSPISPRLLFHNKRRESFELSIIEDLRLSLLLANTSGM